MAEFLCPIHRTSSLSPNAIALRIKERTLTYHELDCLVAGALNELKQRGVKREERVAFLAKANLETILLLFALFRLQAIACPLNPRMPLQALGKALDQLNSHFFLEAGFLTQKQAAPAKDAAYSENQMATLLFTSGTSGAPKIACHSIANHIYSALGSNSATGFGPSDCWLLSLPLFHVGGLAIPFRVFLSGGSLAISDEPLPNALDSLPITHLSLVPTQLYRLLKEERKHALKSILLGGAPISLALYNEALNKGLPIHPTYGLTEMSSQVAMCSFPKQDAISCGAQIPFRELSLSSDGEILVRGKTLFQGYWDKESGLHCPLDEEGWFATRDLGAWIKEGELIYCGRKDHLFISGGENIQPEEIENALMTLQGIIEAIVVASPCSEYGARPAAFIRDESSKHTLHTIREALKPLLPAFKIPIAIHPLPSEQTLKRDRASLTLQLRDSETP